MKHRRSSACRTLLLSLAALALAACGGGGSRGGSAPVATTTGVFTDAPVQGLAYTCSPSGQTSTTDANGQFQFVTGDSCTFRIGNINLPPVTAAVVITPREVAAALAARVVADGGMADANLISQNLFQFFQSLDNDGDPSNGITLPPTVSNVNFAETAPAALFNLTETAFQTQISTVVSNVVQQLGSEAAGAVAVVSPAAALQHAAEQTQRLLSGTWFLPPSDRVENPKNLLGTSVTFLPNGTYLLAELSAPDCNEDENGDPIEDADAFGGSEYGRYTYDALTGDFVVTETISDSTPDCGLKGLNKAGLARLRVLGNDLLLDALDTDDLQGGNQVAGMERCEDEDGTVVPMGTGVGQTGYTLKGETYACRYTLTRAKGTQSLLATTAAPTSLEGSYILTSDLAIGIASVLTIEQISPNNFRYLLTESYGASEDSDGATDGTARGTFTRDEFTGDLTVIEDLNTIKGDGGFVDGNEDGQKRVRLALAMDDSSRLLYTEFRDGGESETTGPDFEGTYERLPLRARINASQVVGHYSALNDIWPGTINVLETQSENFNNTFQNDAPIAYLSLFDNGEFLFGTYVDTNECDRGVAEADESRGNGIEFGRYAVDAVTGELRAHIPEPTSTKRYADTNSACGLVKKGSEEPDRFFLRLLDEGSVLVIGIESGFNTDYLADFLAIETLSDARDFLNSDDFRRADNIRSSFSYFVLQPVISQADVNVDQGLNGLWKLTASTLADDNFEGEVVPVTIAFLGNNYFLTHGSIGNSGEGNEPVDGIEVGEFILSQVMEPPGLALCVTNAYADTTMDAGLHSGEPDPTCVTAPRIVISQNLQSFELQFEEESEPQSVTFTRISKPFVVPIME